MSGGRFDYRNEDLKQITDSIEFDLANNDHVNSETSDNEVWGLNWKPETLVYVRRMLEDVKSLNRLLHEYDFAVCDDSCEDEFLQEARAIYGDLTKLPKPAVVPVTIPVVSSNKYCETCRFCQHFRCLLFLAVLHRNGKYGEHFNRCPACLAEFGTGDKENG